MENIIVHIFSIGFHHKRGCEIEFIYPYLTNDGALNHEMDIWKYLPTLALPDGAHKNISDTVYFVVPGILDSKHKVLFGISCFRQISSECVKSKSDDVTRNTIQKSVVILSSLPLFGAIGALLRGITENYFAIGDFDDKTILIESYYQLNQHFTLIFEDNMKKNKDNKNIMNEELSITNLIEQYEHDTLTLIKVILLRKKVLFFMEPVEKLTGTILTLLSLFPGVLNTNGFQNSLNFLSDLETNASSEVKSELLSQDTCISDGNTLFQNLKSSDCETIVRLSGMEDFKTTSSSCDIKSNQIIISDSSQHHFVENSIPLPTFINTENFQDDKKLSSNNTFNDYWSFSLDIFDERNVLLPYASINMLNILDNANIKSFIIGVTNQLWKMKSSKCDILISEESKNGGIEFKLNDISIEKLIQLTVLDRRFIDYLCRVVRFHKQHSTDTGIAKADLRNYDKGSDLFNEICEDPEKLPDDSIHKFSDTKALEVWLRGVLLDYIKAIFLNVESRGSKLSVESFGSDFIQNIQQNQFFETWHHSIDKNNIIEESKWNNRKDYPSEQSADLTIATHDIFENNSETANSIKSSIIMNCDHPGRFIQPQIGDNIPGYYQFREYADQSKMIVNKSVSEIKKFSTERGSQFKSSMTAGLSRLSEIAKIRGIKFGSSWWQSNEKNDNIENKTSIS